MRGEWSGDEDLGNGSVQILHKLYKSRCNSVRIMEPCHITKFKSDLEDDITFLKEANTATKLDYEAALNVPGKREQKLMELAWNVTGIEELLKQANEYVNELSQMILFFQLGDLGTVKKLIFPFKVKFDKYLKGLFMKKRSVATHLLIFMISDELRNQKPYAVPIQFLSYKSITDCQLRNLQLEIEASMKKIDMDVVG